MEKNNNESFDLIEIMQASGIAWTLRNKSNYKIYSTKSVLPKLFTKISCNDLQVAAQDQKLWNQNIFYRLLHKYIFAIIFKADVGTHCYGWCLFAVMKLMMERQKCENEDE